MIVLTGNSLNERHQEFNKKVNEAITQRVLLEDIIERTEESDVDRLFKISLADKYKKAEYLIETLKNGDSLYISRALKCSWLYNEEFSHIINPEYLEQNLFPELSFKTKRKLLTVISMYVTNDRAASFYNYCMKIKLPNIAMKFLLHTPEDFKIDTIKSKPGFSQEYIIALIGKSFSLAETVLESLEPYQIAAYLRSLSYLYSMSDVDYLDLVEKMNMKEGVCWQGRRLGLRMSKHIIKHHKERILRHTLLYINILNIKMLTKYSSIDDAKNYILRLIPDDAFLFWHTYFAATYGYLLDMVPYEERLSFIRNIFHTRYPGEEFEMDINFYHAGFHQLMTKEEKEFWALKHIEAAAEHFGPDKDFQWYKFVSYEKAFETIKKYILVANDPDARNEILNILIQNAQTDRELESLFNYYYQRHVNEMTRYKEKFIDDVLQYHKYYNFDTECWNAFNKILFSMDVYDNHNSRSCKTCYRYIAIFFAIIHKKVVHTALEEYFDSELDIFTITQKMQDLSEENKELVYEYFINLILKTILTFDIDKYDEDMKYAVKTYVWNILDLMWNCNKRAKDIPAKVLKYVHLNFEEYECHPIFIKITDSNNQLSKELASSQEEPLCLIKDLKIDASLVISKIPRVKSLLIENKPIKLNQFLRKIKTYFFKDVALNYAELFENLLLEKDICEKACDIATYGILQIKAIADVIDFVKKHSPDDSKINHDKIDRKLLYIRKAICKYISMSRPFVPLLYAKKYIVGDYSKFCLPSVQSYAANLPPSFTLELVEFLLKSPVSIQKHGIRLAFQCFSVIDIKNYLDLWNNTKNISLRIILYKAVNKKIIESSDEQLQKELYEAFKNFTLQFSEEDDGEFFNIMCANNLPNQILGDHILSSWEAVKILPDKPKFTDYKVQIINNMSNNIKLIRQDLIEPIVTDHVTSMLIEEKIRSHYDYHIYCVVTAKWNLTAKYIAYLPDKNITENKLEILLTIVKRCINLWDRTGGDIYFIRKFFSEFFDNILSSISVENIEVCLNAIGLLEPVVSELQGALPLIEIYKTLWSLRTSVILRKVLVEKYRMVANTDNVMDDAVILKESVDMFASEFIKLLNESIEKGDYFIAGTDSIKEVLTNFTSCLFNELPSVEDKSLEDVLVDICIKLVDVEKFETHYLALDLLPPNYYYYLENFYKKLISKMKSLNNKEINYFLYCKQVLFYGYDYRLIQGEQ